MFQCFNEYYVISKGTAYFFNLLQQTFNYNFKESARVQINDTERYYYVFLKLTWTDTILS